MTILENKKVVVALGGNAIIQESEEGNITEQFANTRKSLAGIAQMIKDGYQVVVTHGNGPQVGNELIRAEMAHETVPALPLGVLVADTEGSMGYMIEQSLMNVLFDMGMADTNVATIVTQVLVDKDDPSIQNPSKYVGPFYQKEEVAALEQEQGWIMKEDPGRGYRRVVPSPKPLQIINKDAIELLLDQNYVVVAVGGGGIPAYIDDRGWYEGVDGVIDKDYASAVLAQDINAKLLVIVTAVEKVSINYGKPEQQDLDCLTVEEALRYNEQGHFPDGSMGPKVMAAVNFLQNGGEKVIITSIEKVNDALAGNAGTCICK